jgi:transposase
VIRPPTTVAVYLCVAPVDFRLQINGLAALVQDTLGQDPFAQQVYAFTNRRRSAVKCLGWDRTGFVLWHKRLEKNHFAWPRSAQETVKLSGQEFSWLLDGFDLRYWRPHAPLQYRHVS